MSRMTRHWPTMPHDQQAYEQAKREMEQGKIERPSLLRRAQEIKEQLQQSARRKREITN